jgi:NAD(P)-dependent dehydrogenase (short-subunit alcohol dehydrogenase family)
LFWQWGKNFNDEQLEQARERSKLKKFADLDETADAYIYAAKSSTMTGAQIKIDGGAVI